MHRTESAKATLVKILFSLSKRPLGFLTLVNAVSELSGNINLEYHKCFWEFDSETSALVKDNLGCNTLCEILIKHFAFIYWGLC